MRVITGSARGRRLNEPKNMEIRPTTDKVKESIFNIVQFDIEGRRILDLFAGTGQLGIEALSRGAKSASFVDESTEAIKLIKINLEHCGLTGETAREDALSFLSHCGKYDVIFLDPPYKSGLIDSVLRKIIQFDILSEGGIIICETDNETDIVPMNEPYYAGRVYKYGKVKLTVCGKKA
ncbi:MAG: 16S rRNA (guanine(966)-N(2))-methyltransferase RsmD [Firmicutes bacterium HGW-Firmicutes-16]|nr:MAG: 16S rRNA (guanine(966)-N(2))-methyltransferase RsmD [Firmicutes bacterium HGW-Firmicutes-16]